MCVHAPLVSIGLLVCQWLVPVCVKQYSCIAWLHHGGLELRYESLVARLLSNLAECRRDVRETTDA